MTVADKLEPEIENKIAELRKKFAKEAKSCVHDHKLMYYRFLAARDFDLDQAEVMLRKHLQWRQEYKVDTIASETIIPEEVISHFGQSFLGFDKEHCPVKYFAIGNTDFKGLRMSAKFSDRYRFGVQMMEEESAVLEKQNKKVGKNLKGLVYIVDLKNFPFSVATDKKLLGEFIELARMYQDNFPERLKKIIAINVSSYFTIFFQIVKNVVASSILNKLSMYTNPEDWQPVLQKIMDPSDLPEFLGGKKTDPDGDPLCKSFVRHGGPVPTKYYIHKAKNPLSKSKGAKKLVIPRASFSEIELNVKEAESVIEWEFETKTRDIGFGLFFKELEVGDEEKIVELVPLMRLDTEEFSETGMFKCEKPGTYILLFDNSYSWMRSKEIYYKAAVISPKEHEKEMLS